MKGFILNQKPIEKLSCVLIKPSLLNVGMKILKPKDDQIKSTTVVLHGT